jgi:hypothetical protein
MCGDCGGYEKHLHGNQGFSQSETSTALTLRNNINEMLF